MSVTLVTSGHTQVRSPFVYGIWKRLQSEANSQQTPIYTHKECFCRDVSKISIGSKIPSDLRRNSGEKPHVYTKWWQSYSQSSKLNRYQRVYIGRRISMFAVSVGKVSVGSQISSETRGHTEGKNSTFAENVFEVSVRFHVSSDTRSHKVRNSCLQICGSGFIL